ncbi:MAG: AAA family ATPase [Pseudomonadales bacterium]|nr:AAA family ATPase [Pseudomonadales bacterium]
MGNVIVISGPPGAGKSEFAGTLGARLRLPVISKDYYKESLFDTLGYSDRAQSVRFGKAAFEIQYLVAGELIRANVDFILETAFHRSSTAALRGLLDGSRIIQIWLSTDVETLVHRGSNRPRHPGHGGWNDEIENETREKVGAGLYDPLEIGGELITLDTTCFDKKQYEVTINQLVAWLA